MTPRFCSQPDTRVWGSQLHWRPLNLSPTCSPTSDPRSRRSLIFPRATRTAIQNRTTRINMKWTGVMPALTTAFDTNLKIDHSYVARHARWQIENGVSGLIALGSLGEAATLSLDEKIALIQTLVKAVDGKVPGVAAVSALSTDEAGTLAQAAEDNGAGGLMILPTYASQGDWTEMQAHVTAVVHATPPSA